MEERVYILILGLFTATGEFVSERRIAHVVDKQACVVLGDAVAANLSFKMRPMVVKYKCVKGDMA